MREEEQIIRTEYSELMQKSYIDYAMSVYIVARALPDVRDGLKARYKDVRFTICMSLGFVMISRTVRARVLLAIRWVSIIRMVTARSTGRLLSWHRSLRWDCRSWTDTVISDRSRATARRRCDIPRHV